jgi:hypothetical protein
MKIFQKYFEISHCVRNDRELRFKDGVGGGVAAAHPILSNNPLKAPSFLSARGEEESP